MSFFQVLEKWSKLIKENAKDNKYNIAKQFKQN